VKSAGCPGSSSQESERATACRAGRTLLTDVLNALDDQLTALSGSEPTLVAFAAWLTATGADGAAQLENLALGAAERDGAERHYQDIAVLGFACGRCTWRAGQREQAVQRFRDGLTWMRGRRFFVPGQPLAFEADGIALIGTAVGICIAGNPSTRGTDRDWLNGIIEQSLTQSPGHAWERSLIRSARIVLDSVNALPPPLPPSELAADLAAALAAMGFLSFTQDNELQARALIVGPSFRNLSKDRAAVQFASLQWLLRQGATALPNRATIQDVVNLLNALPHGLKRWPWEEKPRTSRSAAIAQQWDLQNEYHVQSLLWALLAPIFPDIEDEEYLRSIGHKHPRVDLAIPSLGLIIEVKFLKDGTQSGLARTIEEIAADTSLYLSIPSTFSQIVPFIWDASRSNDQHAELVSGLRKLGGIADAVVVSRPGRWECTNSGRERSRGGSRRGSK